MSENEAKLVYAKRWLDKMEAELLATLDGLMVSCGLGEAIAACQGWQPKFASLPDRFADPDGSKPTVIFKLAMKSNGWVGMSASLLADKPESLAAAVSHLDSRLNDLDIVRSWHQADLEYEQALAAAKSRK